MRCHYDDTEYNSGKEEAAYLNELASFEAEVISELGDLKYGWEYPYIQGRFDEGNTDIEALLEEMKYMRRYFTLCKEFDHVDVDDLEKIVGDWY